jgi:hypothetical protein
MPEPLTDEQRRAVFAALVAAQDDGLSVAASRDRVAGEFGLTPAEVQAIEREGLDAGWPPLGE